MLMISDLATSVESLEAQMAVVKGFAEEKFLKLNAGKCEIVMFARGRKTAAPVCKVNGVVVPARDVGMCLGYWWKGDLPATWSVEENVWKARRTFFHYGSIGAFQGDLSPLSSGSVLEMYALEWLQELVDDACTSGEGGVLPGRVGKERTEVAEASLKYCCQSGYGDAINEEPDFGEKVRVPAASAECRYEECQWENSGGSV